MARVWIPVPDRGDAYLFARRFTARLPTWSAG